jgi:copper(I)-binding protein
MMKFILLLLIPLALAFPAFADGAGPIHIADAKARPTAPGATTGVVYMVVMNHGTADDVITGLSTPAADKAEMHRSVNENGVMRMDAVGDLPLKANGGVTFEPAGLHVMLTGLKQPLKLGDSFPLTLNFAKAGAVTVTVAVQQIKVAPKAMQDMPGMKM